MKLFSENTILWRVYAIAALVAAGLLAPLIFAIIPWLMLLAYIYLAFHPRDGARFGVPFNLLLALGLPLFFEPLLGTWLSPLLALPVLPLLDRGLRQFASSYELPSPLSSLERLRPTGIAGSLAVSLGIAAAIAVALTSWGLLISTALVTAYLALAAGLILYRKGRWTSGAPVSAEANKQRIVAGQTAQAPVKLLLPEDKGHFAGYLFLRSPHPWFSVKPTRVVLDKPVMEIETSFTPPLAGPADIAAAAVWIDPLGLMRLDFTLDILELLVIPRARYAEWMARKYLEMSRSGSLEPANSVATASRRASRQGIEFYGLRPYQPGDSARAIDWKHTSKLHQVIVKEFQDKTAECAVLAVNLSVDGEEEKDKLVFDLISGALTLAGENIPSALAAYNDRTVVRTTALLGPQQALVQALSLTREVTAAANPRRYLNVPDPRRIRANLVRLKTTDSGAAGRLAELLQLEYAALEEEARQSPITAALTGALAGLKRKANILVVSAHDRDAAALAFNRYTLEAKGYRFIEGVK